MCISILHADLVHELHYYVFSSGGLVCNLIYRTSNFEMKIVTVTVMIQSIISSFQNCNTVLNFHVYVSHSWLLVSI